MHTKLTLRLDEALIRQAKSFAKQRGKSVSRIVSDYFALLNKPPAGSSDEPLTPLVHSLKGLLRGAALTKEDYRRYLKEKYR